MMDWPLMSEVVGRANVNEKMPNKFIAREKPLVGGKFVPFVSENFPNKKYNKERRMKKSQIKVLEERKSA